MTLFLNERSTEQELMDSPGVELSELHKALDDIRWTNKWLGNDRAILEALTRIPISFDAATPTRLVDVGCGGGDQIKLIDTWSKEHNHKMSLSGLDMNESAIGRARKKNVPNVAWINHDVMTEQIKWNDYDIVLCNLFFHHLTDANQIILLERWIEAKIKYIIIIDLHRSLISLIGFKIISTVFNYSHIAKVDGAISIKKGFTRKELINKMQHVKHTRYSLNWGWPFKYILTIE